MTEPYRRKLIEVALPLEAINRASAREKSIRHGHPSTLHLWWARRPLATCRAVLFASMVDDPSSHPELFPTEEAQESERQRLFRLLEELVKWENTTNETILEQARAEIRKSAGPDGPPPVLDPFCGGGSIPLEAQRLGLEAHASDLNPVAVLITKALIEIPPRFAGRPPVHPDQEKQLVARTWKGAEGLAEDVRYYGQWMRDEAEKRISHLYPKVKLPKEQGGGEATVIAWLWARTVKCPNPVCGGIMPLTRTFWLSTRSGAEAWLEPDVDLQKRQVTFRVHHGLPPASLRSLVEAGTKMGRGASFCCPFCRTSPASAYVRSEGGAGRLGAQLLAVVAEGHRGRTYLSADQVDVVTVERPDGIDDIQQPLADDPRAITVKLYGYETFDRLFSNRQLRALVTFCDLVRQVHGVIKMLTGGDENYAAAVVTYLAFALDKAANYWSTLCGWHFAREIMMSTLGRQALPMIWDYAEANPFSDSTGNWMSGVDQAVKVLLASPMHPTPGRTYQSDAAQRLPDVPAPLVSTDPPYYDNVPYSDVSDFFYVWLRRNLASIYPGIFDTALTPKSAEIVAFAYRFGGDPHSAEKHFEGSLKKAFDLIRQHASNDYPLTVYYAFKQQEDEADEGPISTGWEKMLEALSQNFRVTGTWPMRTEQAGGLRLVGRNSLASSIVLVCRPRPENAPLTTRRDFLTSLKRELPRALKDLQRGNIAPVDLAQASIGPGMAIYSRYSKVVEADGSALSVRTALGLINQALDAYLTEQEGEYDADTRWAVSWFEQYAFNEGPFGDAETLSKAKDTGIAGMVEAGILSARAGKVRLLRREELEEDWDPAKDRRLTVWEVTQHLIRTLEQKGESGASELLARVGGLGEIGRDLAYRLYQVCERKGWAQDALPYNGLVVAWPEITRLAEEKVRETPVQGRLGF